MVSTTLGEKSVAEISEHENSSESVGIWFGRDDPEDPQEGWSTNKRWRVAAIAFFVSFTSAFNATANGSASAGVMKSFPGTTSSVFQTSSFTYLFMLGAGPLLCSPISEAFGRRPMLVILTGVICILFLPQALAPNVASIIATRFFQGTAACVEGPVISGVVADLWKKEVRGTGMATFVLTIFSANAIGPLCAGWIAQKCGWRWVYWVQMIAAGVCFILCLFFFPETRGDVILAKRAKVLKKETGRHHYVLGADDVEGLWEAMKISCARPLLYLFTEPIVMAISIWIGFAWGMVFLFVGAVSHVFRVTYGFSQGQGGTVLICGFIGAVFAWFETIYVQDRLYKRSVVQGGGKAVPEVRLYSSAIGALVFAIGCFGFAGTARASVYWVVPCIFIVLVNMGIFTMYLATYSYLAEVYDRYASSANAAQGLLRNTLGATFPFFGVIMYDKLQFEWASTLVGFIALFFALVPWVLIMFGARLRAESKIAMALEQAEGHILREEAVAEKTGHVGVSVTV